MTVSLALLILAAAQIVQAQKDGEAQFVSFDRDDRPILRFSNKRADKQGCGLFVGNTLMDNEEEAFVLPVAHLHWRNFGRPALPETGWLYITPSRIIFSVEIGDKSHAFDLPRTDLKDKPATAKDFGIYPALQFNLKERLPASDSREQKFIFFIIGDKKCEVRVSTPYKKFLERTVSDFDGATAEFRQIAASLKQSGKVEQAPRVVKWRSFHADATDTPPKNTAPPNKPMHPTRDTKPLMFHESGWRAGDWRRSASSSISRSCAVLWVAN